MRSSEEIQQAINDLTPVLTQGSQSDRRVAQITIDTLNWVIGKPSVAETGLKILRGIRQSQNAGVN